MSITATFSDRNQWSDGHKQYVVGTLVFTGSYVLGGVTLDLGAAGVLNSSVPIKFTVPYYRGFEFEYIPGTSNADGKLRLYGTANAVKASGTLTSDNTNVSNNDTVTIGTHVYTFKTAIVVGVPNQVLIGADADGSLLNLIRAINKSGTPDTDYTAATPANTDVTAATSVTSHAFLVTAIQAGTQGNLIASTEAAAHLSWGATTLASGTNGTATQAELAAGAFLTDLTLGAPPFHAIWDQFQ